MHELSAVGHGHIDTAWLWPVAETYRKCVRTFSSATALMDRYPEFRFACSQAQQYAWVKARDPDLYARIRERARAGRWIPVGGTWVEPDCNLPSGESLVRQFLHGQRFFEAEFGARCREFWNPDVFGYNGQLPQLMRGAGIRRFLTQKLSWNAFTKPPYHTFRWAGIDGSEVLAHFPPADTYNAEVTVPELRFNARNYKDHDRSAHSLMLFGHGDGGGGPTPAMLERLRRANDLEGLPRTVQRTPEAFFDLLEAETQDWPTVVGELYFEYHRGTYTTQAETKRAHRKAEVLLHDVEALAAIATRVAGAAYPADALRGLWERLLLTQFHDILPGSSIAEVYADALADLDVVHREGGRLRETALAALAGGDGAVRPVNLSGRARREVVATPDGGLRVVAVPALGAGEEVAADDAVSVERDGERVVLVNGALRATLAPDGDLVSLVHRPSGREALAGRAAVFELYDDRPAAWDAWELDPSHLETGRPVGPATSCTVTAEGPLRAEVVFERPLTDRSHLRETVRLDAHAARVEVHCEVDWHDRHRVLKVAVPIAVRSMTATFEMQFGVAERPTHYNTAGDLARFEVPAHRFADLSEHGFGVALLSESKYGFSAHGGTLRMTLLRGPVWPDPEADQGRHAFAFAVLPHMGGWQDAGVVHDARAFNQPVLWGALPASPVPWLASEDDGLVLDTVKRAEDGDALVVRLYEARGGRGTATLRLGLPVSRVRRANLLEDPGQELAVEEGRVRIAFGPFEVVTLLLA